MSAELIIAAIKLAQVLIEKYRGRAKFADGTVLTQEHIDAAYAKADAPFERIEDRAEAELAKLPPKGTE